MLLDSELGTEHSLICSTGYYDIMKHPYREAFLQLAGASSTLLPEVLSCGSIAGTVTKDAASLCPMPASISGAASAVCP